MSWPLPLARPKAFLKKFLMAGFLERYFIKISRAMVRTTMVVITISSLRKDLMVTKGRRPEPITVLVVIKTNIQKAVVL